MTTLRNFRLRPKAKDAYLDLVAAFPLASIRSEQHLAAAQQVLDRLFAKGKLNAGEQLYVDALGDLIAAYEDVHHAIKTASDSDLLRHFMEARGVTQSELHRQTGLPKSTISEVLAGKRPFSRKMIRTLAGFFRVDSSVLAANV